MVILAAGDIARETIAKERKGDGLEGLAGRNLTTAVSGAMLLRQHVRDLLYALLLL